MREEKKAAPAAVAGPAQSGRTADELGKSQRQAAIAAYRAAHGHVPDFGFAPDRAWIEGAAYADATCAMRAQAALIRPCVICGSDEPFTGACGSSDPRALCKQPPSARAAPKPAPVAQGDALDAAFEAVRKRLCELQRYSFVLDDDGVVRRVQDRVGNWIEFDDAHALFDPVAVDAARAAKKGGA